MTIYSSSRKRMVISKYSNRPPFELKTDESSVISKTSEKFKKSLESINKSYNSIIKQLDEIQIDKKQPTDTRTNKNIIPKIIESFQKITPKREVIIVRNRNYLSSQDSSVQTLFRNKNSNFGKHIPNHRIMTNLLKNFGSGTRMYIEHDQVDTIPTRDTACLKKVRDNCDKIKVDKTTSTSGIVWPVNHPHERHNNLEKTIRNNQPQIPNYCSNKTVDKTKCKIPKRKNSIRVVEKKVKIEEKQIASPISDSELNPTNTDNHRSSHVHTREYTYIVDENITGDKNLASKILNREDSFVQRQVEKFNKLGNKKQGRKKSSKTSDFQKRNWSLNKNYLGMITSARKRFPKIEERFLDHDTTDDYDWSDPADINKPEVRFPKETRHAMETILRNSGKSDRSPLSRYLKHRNLELQPAVPNHQGGVEEKKVSRDRGDFEGMPENVGEVSPCKCSDRHFRKLKPRMIPMKCKQ